MNNQQTVLLTGGAGVVGQALIPKLLKNNFKVIALVRNRAIDIAGIEQIKGDITQFNLGIEDAALQKLIGKVDCFIHSAAMTNFDAAEDEIFNINVNGTENAVKVANQIGARFIYVSTAFTFDLDIPDCLKEYSAYCKTKRIAENIVKTSIKNYTIVRPSIVVGDSATGEIATFQGLHTIIGSLLTGFAPMLPATPESYVDLIPQDVLVNSICALAQRQGSQHEYWITRGAAATNVQGIVSTLSEYLLSINCSNKIPKIVDPEVIDRLFRPVFLPELPGYLRKRLNKLIDYACYFNLNTPFPCNYDELAKEFGLTPMPECKKVFLNNIEYWAEKTNFRAKVAS